MAASTTGRAMSESRYEGDARRGYRDLVAWQKALELATAVSMATRAWPREELYGLTAQVRRAAVSIMSNIAEGHGRTGPKEFTHHLSIAYGSLCEAESQILLAEQLGYLDARGTASLMAQCAEVRRLLLGLLRCLRRTDAGNDRS